MTNPSAKELKITIGRITRVAEEILGLFISSGGYTMRGNTSYHLSVVRAVTSGEREKLEKRFCEEFEFPIRIEDNKGHGELLPTPVATMT